MYVSILNPSLNKLKPKLVATVLSVYLDWSTLSLKIFVSYLLKHMAVTFFVQMLVHPMQVLVDNKSIQIKKETSTLEYISPFIQK